MQLKLHAVHGNGHRGAHDLLQLAGLPRLRTEYTTLLEPPVAMGRDPHSSSGAKGGLVWLRPKLGPGMTAVEGAWLRLFSCTFLRSEDRTFPLL